MRRQKGNVEPIFAVGIALLLAGFIAAGVSVVPQIGPLVTQFSQAAANR